MAVVIPQEGEIARLNLVLADVPNWTVSLFKNNYTPVELSTGGSFTKATFTGYADVAPPVFAAASGGSPATSTADVATYVCSGGSPQTVYGYYVTDGSGKVLFAERFTVPFIFDAVLNTTLHLQLTQTEQSA